METMSNQQASGNQRDLHQNKQILGSFPLPFTAGAAGGNEWLKDLIGHWDSWGNSSLQTRAALSLSGRRQNWGSVGLVHQLKQVATTHVAEWHSKKVVTERKKSPSLHWLLLGVLFWSKNQGRVQEAIPGKSIPFLSLLMAIINPVVLPTGEVKQHYILNQ